jgi:exopolysaccharide biosynthesis polyprenyl glycosylphosphotransferase
VTSVESAEARSELLAAPFTIAADVPPRRAKAIARHALHDGRLRAVAIVLAAAGVSIGYDADNARHAALVATTFAVAWILSVHLVARWLRTVRLLAGHAGVAVFSALGGLALVSSLSFWLPSAGEQPYAEILTMTACAFGITYACEVMKARVATLRSRVLLVGDGRSTRDVIEVLAEGESNAFSMIGIVGDDTNGAIGGIPVLGAHHQLQAIVEEHAADLVVVSVDRGRPDVFARLAGIAGLGFRVVGVPEFYEHAFARVPVRDTTDAWFMSIIHLYQRPYSRLAKRSFDVAVALLGLLLTAPLFIVIAAFVRRDGPVFYRQTRLGDQGVPFTILKFRTMRVDAENQGAVWAQHADPRMTQVGYLLRKLRLDELPQLLNVLRGDMAVVGPRPERPEFLDMLEQAVPFWSRRHLLKPGITGWAQLRSGYASDSRSMEEKLSYDLWYLRHQSLVVDLMICARTVPLLLLGVGR